MKWILFLLLWTGLACWVGIPAQAADGFSLRAESDMVCGETWTLELCGPTDENLAGTRMELDYPADVLSLIEIRPAEPLEGTLSWIDWGGNVRMTFLADSGAPGGVYATLEFFVWDNASGEALLSLLEFDRIDWNGNALPEEDALTLSVGILPEQPEQSEQSKPQEEPPEDPSEPEAKLLDIEPSSGTLRPAFSSTRDRYTLRVGSGVSGVDFYFETENGTASANRRTLNGPGEDTWITVTLKDLDGVAQRTVLIEVSRDAEPEESEPSEDPAQEGVGTQPESSVPMQEDRPPEEEGLLEEERPPEEGANTGVETTGDHKTPEQTAPPAQESSTSGTAGSSAAGGTSAGTAGGNSPTAGAQPAATAARNPWDGPVVQIRSGDSGQTVGILLLLMLFFFLFSLFYSDREK